MAKATEKNSQDERIICLLTGESGSGKSFFIANLKDAFIFDTDLGGGTKYLEARIHKNDSEREEVSSYQEIYNLIQAAARAKTLKKNIVIDHATSLQQEAILRHNPSLDSDYGRGGNKATYEWRKIRGLIKTLDCNLFVVAHVKGEWDGTKEVGKTTDAAKNIEGDMQIVLYLKRPGGPGSKLQPTTENPSSAQVVKWRRDPEDPRGLVPLNFPLTMENFLKIAGEGMTRELKPIDLASAEQVKEAQTLIEKTKFDPKEIEKWMKKAGAEELENCPASSIEKLITYLKSISSTSL